MRDYTLKILIFSTGFGLLIIRQSLLNSGASRLGLAFNYTGGNLMDSRRDPGYPASGGASLEKGLSVTEDY